MGALDEQAVALEIKVCRLTAQVLYKAMRQILREPTIPSSAKIVHGQQSVKKLERQNSQLEMVEVPDQDCRKLRQQLRRYGVDFAVLRDKSAPEKLTICFKSRDTSLIKTALEKCLADAVKPDRTARQPIRELLQKARQLSGASKTPIEDLPMPQIERGAR